MTTEPQNNEKKRKEYDQMTRSERLRLIAFKNVQAKQQKPATTEEMKAQFSRLNNSDNK